VPRYFFDIKDGQRLVDAAGSEFASDAEALREGLIRARAIAKEKPEWRNRQLAIVDNEAVEIGTIPITCDEH
jgi:hypothetical protein